MKAMKAMKAEIAFPAEIQDDINRARLAHLVRALQGALWRAQALAVAMESAAERSDATLRSILKEDLDEVTFVSDEVADEIYTMLGKDCDQDPQPDFVRYRDEARANKA